jgi:GNAT superfamily N-acetyltransferase
VPSAAVPVASAAMATVTIDEPDRHGREALLDALALSFRDNPMNRAIHGPSPRRRRSANRAGLRALVLDLHTRTQTRVIANENGIQGGFIAVPPGGFPLPGASLWRQLGCFAAQGARAMDQWGFVTESLRREHPLEPHWYLAILGVVPDSRGRGLGGRLLETLRALAASDPHPIYLESDRPESVSFYRARGFEILGELQPLGVRCWRLGCELPPRFSGE